MLARLVRHSVALFALGATAALLTASCADFMFPGAPDDSSVLDGPIDGLSPTQLAVHARGDAEFSRRFVPADGLGPLFVATACEACHVGDGKGHPVFDITRFGRSVDGRFDWMEEHGGPQLQNRAILGYLAEQVPGGAKYVARFTAPSVTGLGYLEAVEDATILALADPNDINGDGISGRPSLIDSTDLVVDVVTSSRIGAGVPSSRHLPINGKYIGRFGKKAQAVNLLHQTVNAYLQDMGVTTAEHPRDLYNRQAGAQATDAVADPEVGSGVVSNVVFYLRTLRAPPRRGADRADVREGERLFADIGCTGCHLPSLSTGSSEIAQLDRVEFAPFTDLLLHDMGAELDDGYTEGSAASSEWRTAPLWGIGLAERTQGGTAHYLHDGRAKSLTEAIGFHGGEASRSRAAFQKLTPEQQQRLLAYLRSL